MRVYAVFNTVELINISHWPVFRLQQVTPPAYIHFKHFKTVYADKCWFLSKRELLVIEMTHQDSFVTHTQWIWLAGG